MSFIVRFVKGVIIGIGAVAPGVSGGSLAVIFGIYDKITALLSNIFSLRKNFKQNFIFFAPLALGGAMGVLIFSNIISYLFSHYENEVTYLFIGLISGTFLSVFRQANEHGFKKTYLIPFIISIALTFILTIIDRDSSDAVRRIGSGFFANTFYGAVLGFGTIIPGISASFILMYLGAYEIVMNGIKTLDLSLLIPAGIGFCLSIAAFARLIDLLFKKFYGYTYYTVLGFVIGSVVPIFPGFAFSIEYIPCVLLFIGGFILTYFLCGIKTKRSGA
ncbi:MAG: hypothetical protein BWY15_00189 [Firmicutes bacterium ADurb.Bin193]|nr:MAG: hypothetical protein BWY15_00189 [Firmicutes bacterium ADurb.Bin193]